MGSACSTSEGEENPHKHSAESPERKKEPFVDLYTDMWIILKCILYCRIFRNEFNF
jgi:hypothetical protein